MLDARRWLYPTVCVRGAGHVRGEAQTARVREIWRRTESVRPQLGVNLVLGVEVFLDLGIRDNLETGRLDVLHGVTVLVRGVRDSE